MSPAGAERLRGRRCFALQLASIFGVVLAATSRDWVIALVVSIGIAVAAVAWWRDCRGRPRAQSRR